MLIKFIGGAVFLIGLMALIGNRTIPTEGNDKKHALIGGVIFMLVGGLIFSIGLNKHPQTKPNAVSKNPITVKYDSMQQQEAIERWGNLSPQEARYTFLEQTPAILGGLMSEFKRLANAVSGYLDGKISKPDLLALCDAVVKLQSPAFSEAYLLTLFAPKDEKLISLSDSLSGMENDLLNIAVMTADAIKAGERSSGVTIYLNMFHEDLTSTSSLLDDLLADYRVAEPIKAKQLATRIEQALQ